MNERTKEMRIARKKESLNYIKKERKKERGKKK